MEETQIRIGSDGELIEPILPAEGRSKRKKYGRLRALRARIARLLGFGFIAAAVIMFGYFIATRYVDLNQFTWYRQLCLSRLGKTTLAYTAAYGTEFGVYLSNASGTLSCLLVAKSTYISAQWEPDGAQLTFTDFNDVHSDDLEVINADSSGEKTIAVSASYPWITPQTKDVIFYSSDGVYSVDTETSVITKLYHGPQLSGVVLSPDGKHIAVCTWDKIFVVEPDGSNLKQIANHGPIAGGLVWSVDSRSLFYYSGGLYMVALDGSTPQQITSASNNNVQGILLSPDGKQVAYVRSGAVGLITLSAPTVQYEMNLDASAIMWSPDGKQIIYQTLGNYPQLYALDPLSYQTHRLTNQGWGNTHPSYSSDGKSIAYISEKNRVSDIYVMDADGKNVHQVTHDGTVQTIIGWQPQ